MLSRVLVLGGYGGLGAGISRRLAAAGYEVLGRRTIRPSGAGLLPVAAGYGTALSRQTDIAVALGEHQPWPVVDAT
ncbi:hypothetical protein [Sphingomonas limnosediminicola]|uniref:hypothetical protein n=1 Tax=Sphingomonas limnosediminicola TaxID=940133 RepID=UPI0031D02304